MATVAVFVAIGGGAYAAGIAKNSVGSKQIKDGKVKAHDIAAPGKFIDMGLPVSGVVNPCDLIEGDDQWVNATPNLAQPPGYYRDPLGYVHLTGRPYHCYKAEPDLTVLPEGYRPENDIVLPMLETNRARVGDLDIRSDGSVYGHAPTANDNYYAEFSLDGLSFRCGPSGQDGCP